MQNIAFEKYLKPKYLVNLSVKFDEGSVCQKKRNISVISQATLKCF